jgi:inhibitor of KinA sporulation pathway (predicted exonuclease)
MSSTLEKILVIDLEATCDEPKPSWQGEITEIGLSILDTTNLEVAEKHQTFVVPPSTPVTEFCTRLTTITPEMLTVKNGARTFPEAINWLKKFGSKNRVWASWGDYDRKQFERQCAAENIAYPFGPGHINVKTLFALSTGMNRGIGAKEAVEYCGMEWVGTHHRGLDDAHNIARVLGWILEKARR